MNELVAGLTPAATLAHRSAMRSISLACAMVVLVSSVSGCTYEPLGIEAKADGPQLDPVVFFAGQTQGEGKLHRVFHRPKRMVVLGSGRAVEGRLLLTQRILIQDMPPVSRTLDLHQVAPGQWRGTITDGSGPLTAVADGNMLHVRYPTGTGFSVDQWMYLRRDRRTVVNRMQIKSFGTDWGQVEETIRRVD